MSVNSLDESLPGRVMAIDAGGVRIGIAVSDPTGIFAQPRDFVKAGDWDGLSRLITEWEPVEVVVGHPVGLDGQKTMQTENVERFAAEFARRFNGVRVVLYDERMTTKVAESALLESGMRRADRKMSRDSVSAAVLLQNYLDGKNRGL